MSILKSINLCTVIDTSHENFIFRTDRVIALFQLKGVLFGKIYELNSDGSWKTLRRVNLRFFPNSFK